MSRVGFRGCLHGATHRAAISRPYRPKRPKAGLRYLRLQTTEFRQQRFGCGVERKFWRIRLCQAQRRMEEIIKVIEEYDSGYKSRLHVLPPTESGRRGHWQAPFIRSIALAREDQSARPDSADKTGSAT